MNTSLRRISVMIMALIVLLLANATVTQVTTDWKQIELTTHKEITIQIGTPITEIPNYTWNSN